MKTYLVVLFVLLPFLTEVVRAGDGERDATFGSGGGVVVPFLGQVNAIAIQADGKIVIAESHLARYNRDGSLDTLFGNGAGSSVFSVRGGYARALAIQADGKILAAGGSGRLDSIRFEVARFNSDGSADLSFGAQGAVNTDFLGMSDASAVAIQRDGKILAAGPTWRSFEGPDFAIARYNADGSLDGTFGIGGTVMTDFNGSRDFLFALAIQPDGKIVVAGETMGAIGSSDFAIARYNSDGSLDTAFGVGGKLTADFFGFRDTARTLAVQDDGKILVAGAAGLSAKSSNFAIARLNTDGSLDAAFGNQGKVTTGSYRGFNYEDVIGGIALQADGKIVAVGMWGYNFAAARYLNDGSLDPSFADGRSRSPGIVTRNFSYGLEEGWANAVAIQTDGKIVAAGGGWVSDEFGVLARYENEPPPITAVKLEPPIVQSGTSFKATFSGTNLTDDTYFDVRFRAPGSTTDQIAWNWQQGASASHTVPSGVAAGAWLITGVRLHRDPNDHDGSIIAVSATLSVTAPIP